MKKPKSVPKKKQSLISPEPPSLPNRLVNELAVQKPEEMFTRFKHSVNPGDLIGAMGAVKKFYDITGRKAIISQSTNLVAAYYQGAVHPTVNERGENVCCNRAMWEMLKPLVESQEYVHSFEEYSGQRVDIDFDVIRGKTFVNMPNGALPSWIPIAFPDLAFDMSKPWITLDGKCPPSIKKQVAGKAVINFTERYRNNLTDYFFLKNYAADIVFAGTEREHWLFCQKWQLDVPRLIVKDFLELAYALKECRFFLGNQSMGWNICEAGKFPRILEICQYAANCQMMIGEDSYGFYHQVGVEYYWRTMYNKTMNKQ